MTIRTKRINTLPASEHDHQVALFVWRDTQLARYPDLQWMFAIPNGGLRDVRVARRLKAEGVKAGVWDIFLPVSRGGFHGLWIEMKAGKNKLTDAQYEFGNAMWGQRFQCSVERDWETAALLIENYLRLK